MKGSLDDDLISAGHRFMGPGYRFIVDADPIDPRDLQALRYKMLNVPLFVPYAACLSRCM